MHTNIKHKNPTLFVKKEDQNNKLVKEYILRFPDLPVVYVEKEIYDAIGKSEDKSLVLELRPSSKDSNEKYPASLINIKTTQTIKE